MPIHWNKYGSLLHCSVSNYRLLTCLSISLLPPFFLLTKQLVALFPVSKIWAKKNAGGGKEQVAKLVDDTYRSVLATTLLIIFSSSFCMLQMHAVT